MKVDPSNIQLAYLFESYPLLFQPYITNAVEKMKHQSGIDFSIKSFKRNENASVHDETFEASKKRKVLDVLYQKTHPANTLSFVERRLSGFDIVHVQHSFLVFKLKNLLQLPKEKRTKIVVTLRGSDSYVKPWISEKWKDFYDQYGDKVDAFIVMSEHQKKYVSKWGISNDRIHIIPIAHNIGEVTAPKFPNNGVMRIVSAFRMCWEKNIDGNLRVVKSLVERGVKVEYDMYGGGADAGQAYFLIEKYGLAEVVHFKGRTQNDELLKNLPSYDFYLQLSHSESLGMAVIEAQALGVPAVVSNAGGLPEVVVAGQSAIVMDTFEIDKVANGMIDLHGNKEKYHQFSQQGIDFAQKNFNADLERDRLVTLYESLIHTPNVS